MTGAGSPLLADYRPLPGRFDETLASEGRVRPHWEYLVDALSQLGPVALRERRAEAQRQLDESGVTYTVHGDPGGPERAWQLDPLPMLVSSAEWYEIERGLSQRAELIILVFRDLYGDQQLIRRGILPAGAVYAHSGFPRFLVAGDGGYTVMPGGLTRVAAAQDSFIVSNQAGGTSKDTWILASEPEKHASLLPRPSVANLDGDLPSGTADNLF